MSRFFAMNGNAGETALLLDPEDINHIKNVLRLGPGDRFTLCDGAGADYQCSIVSITGGHIGFDIISKEANMAEPAVNVTLYQGLPKHDKMEMIIQKCVELGVYRIVPVITERTVVRPKDGGDKKIARWNKISQAAAKQSGRGSVPLVDHFMSLQEAVADSGGCAFIPYELEQGRMLGEGLRTYTGGGISIFIGPEGGFSKQEHDFCTGSGVTSVSLGRRILRTETAGMAALTVIMHEFGEI